MAEQYSRIAFVSCVCASRFNKHGFFYDGAGDSCGSMILSSKAGLAVIESLFVRGLIDADTAKRLKSELAIAGLPENQRVITEKEVAGAAKELIALPVKEWETCVDIAIGFGVHSAEDGARILKKAKELLEEKNKAIN